MNEEQLRSVVWETIVFDAIKRGEPVIELKENKEFIDGIVEAAKRQGFIQQPAVMWDKDEPYGAVKKKCPNVERNNACCAGELGHDGPCDLPS